MHIRILSVENNPAYLEDIRRMVESGKTEFLYETAGFLRAVFQMPLNP